MPQKVSDIMTSDRSTIEAVCSRGISPVSQDSALANVAATPSNT